MSGGHLSREAIARGWGSIVSVAIVRIPQAIRVVDTATAIFTVYGIFKTSITRNIWNTNHTTIFPSKVVSPSSFLGKLVLFCRMSTFCISDKLR